MSFDNKIYPNRKDPRSNYEFSRSKQCSRGCRNHGSCSYCENNRTIQTRKKNLISRDELKNNNDDSD